MIKKLFPFQMCLLCDLFEDPTSFESLDQDMRMLTACSYLNQGDELGLALIAHSKAVAVIGQVLDYYYPFPFPPSITESGRVYGVVWVRGRKQFSPRPSAKRAGNRQGLQ